MAARVNSPGTVDVVLFSFPYSVIPNSRDALAMESELGKMLVIMDRKLAHGICGHCRARLSHGSVNEQFWDPTKLPQQDLPEFTSTFEIVKFNLGRYYISTARKPH